MKIVIAGMGKMGWAVAERLLAEGHDVTAIDSRSERVTQAADALDLMALEGNAADCAVLRGAGVAGADLLLAATNSDEQNLVCCMIGRRLGAAHTVARVRDTVYLQQAGFMRESFGLSRLINPDHETAAEISRLLRLPAATRVDVLAHGGLELAECRLEADSPFLGRSLSQLGSSLRLKALVCAVERGGRVSIPKGDFVLQAGDKLSVAAQPAELRAFFKAAGINRRACRSALILGGSRAAIYLAQNLEERGVRVLIIEQDAERCRQLASLLPRAEIIRGDGAKRELLREAGLGRTDGFVALTGSDEENLILALYAKSCGVSKVIAKVNQEELATLLSDTQVDCFVQPLRLVVEQVVQNVRALQNAQGSSVEELRCIVDGRVEALEFLVSPHSRCLDRPLRELPLRADVLLAAVLRGDNISLPGGQTVLQAGDRVVAVTTQSGLRDLDSILLP